MQRQQITGRTTVLRRRDGEVKKIITSTGNEYQFNRHTHQWTTPKPKVKKPKLLTPKQKAVQFAERLRSKATPAESLIVKIFRSIGISYHFQKTIKTESGYRYADFFIPGINWVIEIDGEYHDVPEQQVRDGLRTDEIVKATGYKVVRFTNQQVMDDPVKIIDYILHGIREKLLSVVQK
jgi:very-short-patch-repair endonuclease